MLYCRGPGPGPELNWVDPRWHDFVDLNRKEVLGMGLFTVQCQGNLEAAFVATSRAKVTGESVMYVTKFMTPTGWKTAIKKVIPKFQRQAFSGWDAYTLFTDKINPSEVILSVKGMPSIIPVNIDFNHGLAI